MEGKNPDESTVTIEETPKNPRKKRNDLLQIQVIQQS